MSQSDGPILRYSMPHPGQAVILNHPARFRVVACGRRFGKTELAKLDLMLTAFEGGLGWWVLPTYTMAQDVWRDLTALLGTVAGVRIQSGEKTIYFPSGGRIAVKSGHEPGRLRGAGLHSLVIDEAAYCDEAVWHALRPSLSDQTLPDAQGRPQAARALLLSTPRGRNWFYHAYQKGLDPAYEDWVAWRMPTRANPFIAAQEIEAARRELPARMFAQEYESAFLEDSGTVFRGVSACVRPQMTVQAEAICFGIDWGRVNDFTAIAVMGITSAQVYEVVRFNQLSWSAQRARVISLARRWRPQIILAESNSIGGPNIDLLQAEGLPVRPFQTTQRSKTHLIDTLAVAIEERAIHLPDDPVLLGELNAYEMERLPSGDFRYSAPPSMHDDTVIAVALAWHATRMPRARVQRYA